MQKENDMKDVEIVKTSYTKAPCKVYSCSCGPHSQDKIYGNGQRVHNPFKLKNGDTGYRCTVCGKERG